MRKAYSLRKRRDVTEVQKGLTARTTYFMLNLYNADL